VGRAVAAVGVLCSLGLIAVSGVLNFRFGFGLAEKEFDAWIYGLALVFMDGLKALMPFVALSAWAARHRFGGLSAWGVFGLATMASLVASLGFAEGHRVERGDRRDAVVRTYKDAGKALERTEKALERLGVVRSRAEIETAREAVLARPVGRGTTVGQASDGCTKAGHLSREHCEEYARLGVEGARAAEGERIAEELRVARLRVNELRESGQAARDEQDPQVAIIGRLWSVVMEAPGAERVRVFLGLLFALVVEVGSGAGLYLSSLLLRPAVMQATGEREGRLEGKQRAHGRRVKAYMAERWLPCPRTTQLASHQVFDDYLDWCKRNDLEPMSEAWVLNQIVMAVLELDPDQTNLAIGRAGSNLVFYGAGLRALESPSGTSGSGSGGTR